MGMGTASATIAFELERMAAVRVARLAGCAVGALVMLFTNPSMVKVHLQEDGSIVRKRGDFELLKLCFA